MTDVTLVTIGNGAAVELFDREFQEVLANIADPNTDAKTPRKITITVTIKPSDDREMAAAAIQVASKLATAKPAPVHLYFGLDGERYVAKQVNPAQPEMDFGITESNVMSLTGGEK